MVQEQNQSVEIIGLGAMGMGVARALLRSSFKAIGYVCNKETFTQEVVRQPNWQMSNDYYFLVKSQCSQHLLKWPYSEAWPEMVLKIKCQTLFNPDFCTHFSSLLQTTCGPSLRQSYIQEL